jgi:hypothetical protein
MSKDSFEGKAQFWQIAKSNQSGLIRIRTDQNGIFFDAVRQDLGSIIEALSVKISLSAALLIQVRG